MTDDKPQSRLPSCAEEVATVYESSTFTTNHNKTCEIVLTEKKGNSKTKMT
jgi:hypothetical protein